MSDEARTGILKGLDQRLWGMFAKPNGTTEELFREHEVGPVKPIKGNRPRYTVTDNGQRRGDPGDNDSGTLLLSVRLFLHVCDTWERQSTVESWTNRVAKIRTALAGRLRSYGVREIRYLRDEPLDVVFLSGDVQGDWVMDFEVEYFDETDELQEWG